MLLFNIKFATILENNNVTITKLFYYIKNNFVIVTLLFSNIVAILKFNIEKQHCSNIKSQY